MSNDGERMAASLKNHLVTFEEEPYPHEPLPSWVKHTSPGRLDPESSPTQSEYESSPAQSDGTRVAGKIEYERLPGQVENVRKILMRLDRILPYDWKDGLTVGKTHALVTILLRSGSTAMTKKKS